METTTVIDIVNDIKTANLNDALSTFNPSEMNYLSEIQTMLNTQYAKTTNYAQGTDEWLNERMQYLTATAMAPCIGISAKKGASTDQELATIIYAKVLKKEFPIDTFVQDVIFKHGHTYEDKAIQRWVETQNRPGFEIVKVYHLGIVEHPKIPWLAASPDGLALVRENGEFKLILLEVKCPYRRKIEREVPVYYYPQVQLQLEVFSQARYTHFIQYRPPKTPLANDPNHSEELVIVSVTRDSNYFTKALPLMKKVWDRILFFRDHLELYMQSPEYQYAESEAQKTIKRNETQKQKNELEETRMNTINNEMKNAESTNASIGRNSYFPTNKKTKYYHFNNNNNISTTTNTSNVQSTVPEPVIESV